MQLPATVTTASRAWWTRAGSRLMFWAGSLRPGLTQADREAWGSLCCHLVSVATRTWCCFSREQYGWLYPQTPANFLSADFLAPWLQRNWEKWQEHRTVRYLVSNSILFYNRLQHYVTSFITKIHLKPVILIIYEDAVFRCSPLWRAGTISFQPVFIHSKFCFCCFTKAVLQLW